MTPVESCPVCGSGGGTALFTSRDWIYLRPGSFRLVRCDDCGAVYPAPRPSDTGLRAFYPADQYYAYSEASPHDLFARRGWLAQRWYDVVRGLLGRRYGYRNFADVKTPLAMAGLLPLLRRRATFSLGVLLHPWMPDGRLLDVGCGAGRYLDLMRALGWSRVVGVDISETAVRRARTALGIEAYAGELHEIRFPDDSFDAVSLSHTLEHVSDPTALLTEVRRVARPGGRVVIVVPNVASLVSRLRGEYWVGLDTPRHLVNFSPEALRRVIGAAGLEIEQLTTSAEGSYQVDLFSTSRARGDPHAIYTDDLHRFGPVRRASAAGTSLAERALCRLHMPVGEEICAVARA